MPHFRTYSHLFFLLLFFLLIGCCNQKDLSIEPVLRTTWLPYQPQQQISFIGEKGDTINFLVLMRTEYQETTDKACGPYRIQTEEVIFTTPTDPDLRLIISLSHEIVFNLKAFRNNPYNLGLDVKFNTVSNLYISPDWRDTYAKVKTVNGQNIAQLIQVFGNTTPGPVSFAEILYAPHKGLVAFKTFTGGWYYPV